VSCSVVRYSTKLFSWKLTFWRSGLRWYRKFLQI